MAITFSCAQCGKSYTLDDSLAGKQAKCPCGTEITVPAPSSAPVAPFATSAPGQLPPVAPMLAQPMPGSPYASSGYAPQGGGTADGGETFSGEEQQDPADQSLGDGATMGGDTAAHSLGDQSTFGDANADDEMFDDGMNLEGLSERYTEEGVLGKGGFGEVVLATDKRLNRKVAIKRIQGKAARSKTAVQRFLTEAQSIAALNHNNIVQIYDYGRAADGPFLVMECVQGGSLLDQCRKGPIELDEAVKIFSQVCDGLAKAHAENIIHRDIKPANILMTEDGVPKLTDFGLAKDHTADTGMTIEGAVIGTLDFMPPEQRQRVLETAQKSLSCSAAHLNRHRHRLKCC